MTSPKQIFSATVLALAIWSNSTLCLAGDPQSAMHALVERYHFGDTKSAQWEADKKVLAGYSPDQRVRALVAELDIDRTKKGTRTTPKRGQAYFLSPPTTRKDVYSPFTYGTIMTR